MKPSAIPGDEPRCAVDRVVDRATSTTRIAPAGATWPTPPDLSPSRSLTRGARGGETYVLDVRLGTVAVKSDAPGHPPVPVEPSDAFTRPVEPPRFPEFDAP